MITYSYENCQISHFALKRVEGDCHCNKERTVLVGVMCKLCPYYERDREEFIVCSHPDNHDDEGASDARYRFVRQIENNALCALDY